MNLKKKTIFVLVLIISLSLVAWVSVTNRSTDSKVTYSQFLHQMNAGNIASVEVSSDAGVYPSVMHLKNGQTARTVLPPDIRELLKALQDNQVSVEIQDSSRPVRTMANAIPFLLLLVLWFYFLKRGFPNGPTLWS